MGTSTIIGWIRLAVIGSGLLGTAATADREVQDAPAAEREPISDFASGIEGEVRILWLAPEGSRVKKGERLYSLDGSGLGTELAVRRTAVGKAEAALEGARIDLELAEVELREYTEGIAPQQESAAEGAIRRAEAELVLAVDEAKRLEAAESQDELVMARARLAVDGAEETVQQAKLALKTLQGFTRPAQIRRLLGAVRRANAEANAKESAYRQAEQSVRHVEMMFAQLGRTSPVDGIVIHPNGIEVDGMVREHQVIVRVVVTSAAD